MDAWLDSNLECSIEEAADFLRISQNYLKQALDEGKIPSYCTEGKLLVGDILRFKKEINIQQQHAIQELTKLGQEIQGDDDPDEDPIISQLQAAHILRISPQQLTRLVEAGEIPMLGKGRMKFAMKDLREFNERRNEDIDRRYSLSREYKIEE